MSNKPLWETLEAESTPTPEQVAHFLRGEATRDVTDGYDQKLVPWMLRWCADYVLQNYGIVE